MNIIIVHSGPFPFGMAAVNRMISYARGLVELSHRVYVLCIKPSEHIHGPVNNTLVTGTYAGINFTYTSGTTQRKKIFAARVLDSAKGLIRALRRIRKLHKNPGIDVIFMGLTNLIYTSILFFFCRIRGIKIIQERSEYPFIGINNFWQRFNLFIYLHVTCKLFDGLFVITEALKQYFERFIRRNAKIMILPMLVEPDRFTTEKDHFNTDSEYIAYCGVLSGDKDGIPILIDAFKAISQKHRNLKLFLIGETDVPDFNGLVEKISQNDLTDRVVFTGRIERDQLPAYLQSSKILALARPESKQAEGGFPTKLGEYLAAGRPVVVTSVGEIPVYLKDGVNAFIAKPNDPVSFAEKLDFAISNPELADKIGEEGRKLVYNEFNYKVQSQKLADFITSL
ncbi:MAG: hypothetical protein AMS27_15465 [Bacteroides sp. SM23_62_1]|nr:MAG: hypothetical protein AMS27_15465 [Bacteroides sp. SM23_62_1]